MWELPSLAKRQSPVPDLSAMGPDVYSLHRADGQIMQIGANAERVLAIPADDLAGKGFLSAIHVQDRVAVAKAISDCLAHDRLEKTQFRIVGATDCAERRTMRWFELRCMPTPEATLPGEDHLALVVLRDISERRKLEDELRTQREIAEMANVAKSRFLANVSHELRTPLNAILGFSELLQSDAMASMPRERGEEYVGLIHSSASHLLNVLNDILDMSKIEAGKYEIYPEPMNLADALRSSCAILQGHAEAKKIKLKVDTVEDLPEIIADERAIKQITINLVSNAVKFTDDGGEVSIEASRSGGHICVKVVDNGIGMEAENLQHLGLPFYQADNHYDRKYQGTGLGLSVVYGLIQLHGGKINVASEKGAGTSIEVMLPIQPPHAKPVPASERLEIVRAKSGEKAGGEVALENESRRSA